MASNSSIKTLSFLFYYYYIIIISLSYALEYQNTEALRILPDYVKNQKLENVLVKKDCDNFTLLQKATALVYSDGAKMIADLENRDYGFMIPVNEPMSDCLEKQFDEEITHKNVVAEGEDEESNEVKSNETYNENSLIEKKMLLIKFQMRHSYGKGTGRWKRIGGLYRYRSFSDYHRYASSPVQSKNLRR